MVHYVSMLQPPTPVVLVVDDEADIREMLRLRLEIAGLKIATAANGQEAVELARRLEPAAVILDLQMPVMSGTEALPLLREIDPSMRIVLHSGVANLDAHDLTGVNRPDAVIVKGSPLPALVETIHDLTRQSADDQHYLEVQPIALHQAVNAFDSWLGLNARIRESDGSEPERREVPGLDSLTRIFFELGLQMLEAAQHRASEVTLRMWVRRGSAEVALRALENIRGGGFEQFYESWGYVAVPEAVEALRELSERLTEALVTTIAGKAP